MADRTPSARRGDSRTTRVVVGSAVGVLALAGAVATAAAVLSVIVARTVIIPPSRRTDDIQILDLDQADSTIVLSSTPDSRLPGEYSFWFTGDSGHARLGEILEQDAPGYAVDDEMMDDDEQSVLAVVVQCFDEHDAHELSFEDIETGLMEVGDLLYLTGACGQLFYEQGQDGVRGIVLYPSGGLLFVPEAQGIVSFSQEPDSVLQNLHRYVLVYTE